MKKLWLILSVAIFLVAIAGCSQDSSNPVAVTGVKSDTPLDKCHPHHGLNVIPPDASPHGKTYSEWSAAWWQWLWSAPADQNPGLDETGEFVDWNQSGPVWFLAPAYYGSGWERTADIPQNKMLFIDLGGFFTSIQMGDGADEAELRATADFYVGILSNVIIEVDGQRLENVEDFRFQSPDGLISYTVPDNNMFQWFGYDLPAGTYENDAVADGYYVMLPPLSRGEHTIFLSADFGDPYNDVVQVTYHLTVGNQHHHHHHEDEHH